MANAIVNNGGFLVSIVCTVATTGTDKGKVTGFGSATVFDFCGVHKPTYKSQESSSSAGENIEITTGSGVIATAPKKTKKVSLTGASTTTASAVTDEYEFTILDASQDNLNLFRGYEKNGTPLIFLSGYGYDQDNVDHGFEAIQGKITEISRGTAANGENALTVKVKGAQVTWASSATHTALNTKVGTVGTSGVVTPLGEEEVDLTSTSRQFTSDDATELQAGRIVPKD